MNFVWHGISRSYNKKQEVNCLVTIQTHLISRVPEIARFTFHSPLTTHSSLPFFLAATVNRSKRWRRMLSLKV